MHRLEWVEVRVYSARRQSPTASSTATKSASTSRWRRCGISTAGTEAARPNSPGMHTSAAWPGSCNPTWLRLHTDPKSNLPASIAARLLNRAKQAGRRLPSLACELLLRAFPASPRNVGRARSIHSQGCHAASPVVGPTIPRHARPGSHTQGRRLTLGNTGGCSRLRDTRRGRWRRVRAGRCPDRSDSCRRRIRRHPRDVAGALRNARLTLQIDIGLGDAVWPAPQRCMYPRCSTSRARSAFAYPREAVVAEKFEAMVALGDRNSRIKDFFDIHDLACQFEFDRATLVEAARRISRGVAR